MKPKKSNYFTQNNNIKRIAIVVGLLLLIPLYGNIFINGWNWGLADFVFAGLFFFVLGFSLDFISKYFTKSAHRIIACVTIIVIFFLIWVELAVDAVSQALTLLLS